MLRVILSSQAAFFRCPALQAKDVYWTFANFDVTQMPRGRNMQATNSPRGRRSQVKRPATARDATSASLLGRHVTGSWEAASRREWLVTNGLGGFAAGTVSGANTRRYHGMLIASFTPPIERVLLLAKLEVTAYYLERCFELGANEYADGTVAPAGFVHIESFRLIDGVPTWHYALADALVEQQIFMQPGANTTFIGFRLLRASAPVQLALRPLCTWRDYHSQHRGIAPWRVETAEHGCTLHSGGNGRGHGRVLRLALEQGRFEERQDWYWRFRHGEEAARGLDELEDLFTPGEFYTELDMQQRVFLSATTELQAPAPGSEVLATVSQQAQGLVAALPAGAPAWVCQLAIAAGQFIVRRSDAGQDGQSIIAGYPWFADWGRDTMIALPGLASALQRHATAAAILRTYARYVDRGMLPNRFPDGGEAPEYNTADATLWFFHALDCHVTAAGDDALAAELLPALRSMIEAHVAGTRHGIRVDPRDGLLAAGEPGVQLTWMDARIGNWPVTPRIGKAVEINALWLNALHVGAKLAARLGDVPAGRYCQGLLERAGAGYARFWNAARRCLYDVIDVEGRDEHDASIRPNQLLALSLPYSALEPLQASAVLETCARKLLTSHGLRSLESADPRYLGRYGGDARSRDGAYHQGTVWSWLLGPFALAHYRVHGDARLAQSYLAPIAEHLRDACIGSISEIFDGDAPHAARGCFAQAWSVGEVLRAWLLLERNAKRR
jgi:predicted glycogen debranching enzyme